MAAIQRQSILQRLWCCGLVHSRLLLSRQRGREAERQRGRKAERQKNTPKKIGGKPGREWEREHCSISARKAQRGEVDPCFSGNAAWDADANDWPLLFSTLRYHPTESA
jgi:hypothetical protein